MNKAELLDMLVRNLKEYHKGLTESVIRNQHMHEAEPVEVVEARKQVVDAVLVDFMNFVAMKQGIDLALYAKDLYQ